MEDRQTDTGATSGSGDRFVVWKVRLFMLGAALALGGMALSLRWLIWTALFVLAAGLALRFAGKREPRR